MEIRLFKAFGGRVENNPKYQREFLNGKVKSQAHVIPHLLAVDE